MDYTTKKLAEIVRNNINKMEDAGCGMYNLSLKNVTFRWITYPNDVIFQIYPYEHNEDYGKIFLLLYFQDSNGFWDNKCVSFDEMSLEEKEYIYSLVENTLNSAEENEEEPSMRSRGQELLDEYNDCDTEDTTRLLLILDKMADYITDIVYNE